MKQVYVSEVGDIFRIGEVWTSPRGTKYHVTDVYDPIGTAVRQAVLRRKLGGTKIGRRVERDWDAVEGWVRNPDDNQK